MTKFFTILLIIFALVISSSSQQNSETTIANFVAFDKFSGLSNPREPKQMFIIEVQKSSFFQAGKLIKVVYYPKTDGFRGGAKFLESDTLNYKNIWKMKLRQPSEEEKLYCEFENYLKTSDGEVDTDEKSEPTLKFHSTQIDADLKFNNLERIPCMILDSFLK